MPPPPSTLALTLSPGSPGTTFPYSRFTLRGFGCLTRATRVKQRKTPQCERSSVLCRTGGDSNFRSTLNSCARPDLAGLAHELHDFQQRKTPQCERSCNRRRSSTCNSQSALAKFMYADSKVREKDIIATVGYETIVYYGGLNRTIESNKEDLIFSIRIRNRNAY